MVEKRSKGRSELTIEKLYHHLDHYIDVLRLHNAVLLYLVLVLVLKLYLSTFFRVLVLVLVHLHAKYWYGTGT